MLQHQGVWLPDGEKHFQQWMNSSGEIIDGRGTYQIKKWRACLPWIRKSEAVAVDVGAHVGFWSIQMAQRFAVVNAFEPMAEFRECWKLNIEPMRSQLSFVAKLHDCALGAAPGRVRMNYNPAESGNTHVGGDGDIEMCTLDSFEFANVDFIKLDCEGYELFALRGAEETLKRWRPCVIVEQKPGRAQKFGLPETGAVDYLQSLGAVLRAKMSGDYILSWDSESPSE